MSNKYIDFLYVFNEGRSQKINNRVEFSNDFYYFFNDFKNEGFEVDFIEINKKNILSNSNMFQFMEKILRKVTGLPFYSTKLLNEENIIKIKSAKNLILTNETTVFSTFFFLLKNKKSLNLKTTIFLMGLTEDSNNPIQKSIKKLLIKMIFKLHNRILFLSEREKEFASRNFDIYSNKMYYFPFIVDQNFWHQKNFDFKSKKYILFIGNDKNRDYLFLKSLANKLKNYNFIFISNNEKIKNFKLQNTTIIKGDWRQGYLTDKELLNYYSNAKLTIIPLLQSRQPSGQSVAMQSMSLGVPVLITKTDGFWDQSNFENQKNIIFFDNNNLNEWAKMIESLFYDDKKLFEISTSALDVMKKYYNKEFYFKYLKNIINN